MAQSFRSLKCPLKNIVKDPDKIIVINTIVSEINYARFHMLQFSKLYTIYLIDNTEIIPVFNKSFFLLVLRILSEKEIHGKAILNLNEFTRLLDFYNTHYKPLMYTDSELIKLQSLKSVKEYMIIDVITDIENNIKMHHFDHLVKYVKSSLDIYENIKFFRKQKQPELVKLCFKISTNLISDLYSVNIPFKSSTEYHNWIIEEKTKIFPQRSYLKDSIYYDIKANPQDYLQGMFYMANKCENNEHSFLSIFPLKTNIIHGHIRIDTKTLFDIFASPEERKDYISTKVDEYKELLWGEYFRTNKEIFNSKNFKFTGSIQTDGFSATILLKNKLFTTRKVPKQIKTPEIYIDNLSEDIRITLNKTKTPVYIDPNKADLLYCGSGSKETFIKFRYTQNQRNKETRRKKHQKILEAEKVKNPLTLELETELSKFSSKTISFQKFKEYILVKNKVNHELLPFYNRILWRKLRLSAFVRTKQSESKMIKNFKNKFGSPENAFIAIGDWSQKSQMKFHEPTKGKGFRSIFRKAGYSVYLVNEKYTSKRCSKCHNGAECEKFKKIENPRPNRENSVICNGLVRCKICKTLFNRDTNAVLNIRQITLRALKLKRRPTYLCKNSNPVIAGVNHETV